jgi:hypothetical protein
MISPIGSAKQFPEDDLHIDDHVKIDPVEKTSGDQLKTVETPASGFSELSKRIQEDMRKCLEKIESKKSDDKLSSFSKAIIDGRFNFRD